MRRLAFPIRFVTQKKYCHHASAVRLALRFGQARAVSSNLRGSGRNYRGGSEHEDELTKAHRVQPLSLMPTVGHGRLLAAAFDAARTCIPPYSRRSVGAAFKLPD